MLDCDSIAAFSSQLLSHFRFISHASVKVVTEKVNKSHSVFCLTPNTAPLTVSIQNDADGGPDGGGVVSGLRADGLRKPASVALGIVSFFFSFTSSAAVFFSTTLDG